MNVRWLIVPLGVAVSVASCEGPPVVGYDAPIEARTTTPAPSVIHGATIPQGAFAVLKDAAGAHAELCDNDGSHPKFPDDADRITKSFCQDLKPGGVIPTPGSLADLQKLLGLDFKDPNGGNGVNGNPGFAMLGHSSSLVSRFVSSINPRAFVFTPPPADGSKPVGYAILAFTRGEQFAEVAVHDPVADEVNLYIVFFKQACQDAPGGCTFGDLLTPKIETGWSDVRVYESSTSLNDTIGDCAQCHQPDSTKPNILRMQELAPPYTHFFSPQTEGGRALLEDFHAAHGTSEDYGPIPASMIDKSDPAKLRDLIVAAGFGDQPNMFDSKAIETEVAASASGQPKVNVPSGTSATWQALYDRAVAGQMIAVPYHDVKVTDPDKLAAMTDIYKQVASGKTPAAKLPDIRDVFLDQATRAMGFAPKEGLDGRGVLTQVCGQCHNGRLDQTISRAKFNALALDKMDRAERDVAISRLLENDGSAQKMPPLLFRTLTDDERQLVIDELQK